MYVVPEDLREDVEHYCDKIEREKRRRNGSVIYRYSRRKINKQVVIITKISLVMIIGFVMIAALCGLSQKEEEASNYQVYGGYSAQPPEDSGNTTKAPIAYYHEYVPVPIYNNNQTYTIYQPVLAPPNYQEQRARTYTSR